MSLLAMMQLIYQLSHYTIAATVGEVPQDHKEIARCLIYGGHSIIFGHSPHILRVIKICKQDLIIYAMLSGNVVDKPSSNLNRVVFICVLIAGIVFQAMIIATITDAAVIMSFDTTRLRERSDVKNKVFVVAAGSLFTGIVQSLGGRVIEIAGGPDIAAQYYLTHQDSVAGFVADHAVLYIQGLRTQNTNIILSILNLRNDELVFLYNKNFPYQSEIDQGLLFLQNNDITQTFCSTYLGDDSHLCVL